VVVVGIVVVGRCVEVVWGMYSGAVTHTITILSPSFIGPSVISV